jgi:hypothetical protein
LAVTPKTDEAFLREVDEELRRDQIVGVWKNYGRVIVGLIVAGLAIFAGVLGWRAWSHGAAEKQAIELQQAYDSIASGNAQAAKAPIDKLAGDSAPGYRALAKLLQGNDLLAAGKTKEAAAKYGEVAGDSGVGQPIRDLATIRQTQTEFDALAPQVVIDRLKPLATSDSAWLGSAGEMVAMADLKLNRTAEARAMFKLIAESDKVPDSIRLRAVQATQALDTGTNVQKGK